MFAKSVFGVVFIAILGLTAFGQSSGELALRRYFEGKKVLLKLDMPGSKGGVDIYVDDPSKLFDFDKHSKRLRQVGISIGHGELSTVTKIEVHKGVIEFQLDGGGFTMTRAPSAPVAPKPTEKSPRELSLESDAQKETDPDKLRYLQSEIAFERDRRERKDRRNKKDYDDAVRERDADISQARATGGSRFNLKFKSTDTSTVTPEQLMQYLSRFVDFSPMDDEQPQP